jgi:hypothetical protein
LATGPVHQYVCNNPRVFFDDKNGTHFISTPFCLWPYIWYFGWDENIGYKQCICSWLASWWFSLPDCVCLLS